MSKMIQVRNVPEDIHRELKSRAARAGMSLSDYLLREMERLARLPTFDDWWRDAQADGVVALEEDSAEAVRAEREARTRHLAG
jgi:antitoxin FitA